MDARALCTPPGVDGLALPRLGQGTWEMGRSRGTRRAEADALRLGMDLGMTLIDTAEMYAEGGAEEVVADAIDGRRDDAFVVSKVYPWNASRAGTVAACERSLRRLRTDRIDLYLLHWAGEHPIEETLAAFVALRDSGKIRHFGVSNLDVHEMEEAVRAPGGDGVACDQILLNLVRRGPERRLLPWCHERDVRVMAYSPLEQGRLPTDAAPAEVARRHGAPAAQVAIAWTLRDPRVCSIPKASRPEHVRDNAAAAAIALSEDDLALLDAAFPVPAEDGPLECL